MIYSIDLHITTLIGVALSIFILGMMAGWKWLPPPIDRVKENLINQLWNENLEFKMKALQGKKGKANGSI